MSAPRTKNQRTKTTLYQPSFIPAIIAIGSVIVDLRRECRFLCLRYRHHQIAAFCERSYASEPVGDLEMGGIVAVERYGAVLRNGKLVTG